MLIVLLLSGHQGSTGTPGHLWQPPGGHCSCPPFFRPGARVLQLHGGLAARLTHSLSCPSVGPGPAAQPAPSQVSSSLQMGTFTSGPLRDPGAKVQGTATSRPRLSECPVW